MGHWDISANVRPSYIFSAHRYEKYSFCSFGIVENKKIQSNISKSLYKTVKLILNLHLLENKNGIKSRRLTQTDYRSLIT